MSGYTLRYASEAAHLLVYAKNMRLQNVSVGYSCNGSHDMYQYTVLSNTIKLRRTGKGILQSV